MNEVLDNNSISPENITFADVTEEPPFDFIEFFGSSHPDFYMVHITGLVALSTSNLISTCTLIYLSRTSQVSFFRRKIGKYTITKKRKS